MKKSLVLSLMIGLFMLGIVGSPWAAGGPVAIDLKCTEPTGCVQTNEISDSAVTNSKIADGSVTDAKIGGTISVSKIEKPANVIIVAKSGGDFTSIQTALNSIAPSATNPYVIKIMPGTYSEDITMKSYVHLQGSGRDVTTLGPAQYVPIYLNNLTNVTVSGFTISDAYWGIQNYNSSVTISDNTIAGNSGGLHNESYPASTAMSYISGNIFTGNSSAIFNEKFSSLVITGNTIIGNSSGIYNVYCSPTISGNMITENDSFGIGNESLMSGSTIIGSTNPTIIGNIITWNGAYGISNIHSSSPKIINNRITDNGGTSYTDIYVDDTSAPNISFNIYDDVTGTTGVGQFNVTSTGDLAPAP